MDIQKSTDLLWFLLQQKGQKPDWFSHTEQKITGIQLAHQIAAAHADTMTPDQVVRYVNDLNDTIYKHIIKKDKA